jgi:hypothetical protein
VSAVTLGFPDEPLHQRIASLELELAGLRKSLSLRRAETTPDPERFAAELGIEREFAEIKSLTEKMFPGEICVVVEADPECPEEPFIVFCVRAVGDVQALVERQVDWHSAALRLAPSQLNRFRISIAPA